MHSKKFIYQVSNCINMLSSVMAFYVDPSYDNDEEEREKFITDYFEMAQDYMEFAKSRFNEKK